MFYLNASLVPEWNFTLFDDVQNVFVAIADAVTAIWSMLAQGVKAFGTLINMIFEALSLPVFLNGVLPNVLYTMIAFVIGCAIVKLIFTRGGSR